MKRIGWKSCPSNPNSVWSASDLFCFLVSLFLCIPCTFKISCTQKCKLYIATIFFLRQKYGSRFHFYIIKLFQLLFCVLFYWLFPHKFHFVRSISSLWKQKRNINMDSTHQSKVKKGQKMFKINYTYLINTQY